jgi:hypothetical protein
LRPAIDVVPSAFAEFVQSISTPQRREDQVLAKHRFVDDVVPQAFLATLRPRRPVRRDFRLAPVKGSNLLGLAAFHL